MNGRAVTSWMESLDRVDVDAARPLAHPDFRWIAPPSSLKANERSVDELFRWLQERANQVSSLQHWNPVLRWLSPNCNLSLGTVRAVGLDGEAYEWTRIYVSEWRDGLLASVREFETDSEQAAFDYADTLVAPRPGRLEVRNRASETVDAASRALQAHDVDNVVAIHSERFVYDDRRRLSGDPVQGRAEFRRATERVVEQYSHIEWRTLAVRGDRLALAWGRWSDDAGNEMTYLAVFEVDDDGQVTYHGRFDGDNFDDAYRELEHRYYAGEGSAFATNGRTMVGFVDALDRLDVDAAHRFSWPDCRMACPSVDADAAGENWSMNSSGGWQNAPSRCPSSRTGYPSSVGCRLRASSRAATCGRSEQTARSTRGRGLTSPSSATGWSHPCASSMSTTRMRRSRTPTRSSRRRPSRLAVSNRASQVLERAIKAMRANDAHTTIGFYADPFTYDDRRRISGDPIDDLNGLLAAAERILAQYNRFDQPHARRPGRIIAALLESMGRRRRKRDDKSASHRGRRRRANCV